MKNCRRTEAVNGKSHRLETDICCITDDPSSGQQVKDINHEGRPTDVDINHPPTGQNHSEGNGARRVHQNRVESRRGKRGDRGGLEAEVSRSRQFAFRTNGDNLEGEQILGRVLVNRKPHSFCSKIQKEGGIEPDQKLVT